MFIIFYYLNIFFNYINIIIAHVKKYVYCISYFIYRKELVAYDRSQSEQQNGDTLPVYAGLLQNYDGDVTKGT